MICKRVRHIILGSNTLVGASIIRVLESIGGQEIVACSPNGTIPEGVIAKNIKIVKADNLDPYSLMELLDKDDIVYNAQVLEDEDTNYQEAEMHHIVGWINLLGIATNKKVKKIIAYMPQLLGWKVQPKSDETSTQYKSSRYQQSLHGMLNIARQYWSNEDYGWSNTHIKDLADAVQITLNYKEQDEQETISQTRGPTPPKLGNSQPPSISGPQSPVGLPTPPNITGTQTPVEGPQPPKINKEQKNSEETQEMDEEDEKGEKEEEDEDLIDQRVPLVIGRVARCFGPFDYDLTKTFCKAVRLQRITVVGKINQTISWCNPLDAARALIIMSEDKVKNGQYIINGFNATALEILHALDQVNHSKIQIKHKSLLFNKINYQLKKILTKIGLKQNLHYSKLVRLNCQQLFSDQLARETWEWKPRWNLLDTAKESINWYVNHVI